MHGADAHRTITMPKTSTRPRPQETLPYRIELCGDADSPRRILARAVSLQLARAIFASALAENPQGHITLRHGNRVIADSRDLATASG